MRHGLYCLAFFGWLTHAESRALNWPPRYGFTVPRGARPVLPIPPMRNRMCVSETSPLFSDTLPIVWRFV